LAAKHLSGIWCQPASQRDSNPLGIAAAHAVLDVIEEEGLCGRAIAMLLGNSLKQRLASLKYQVPEIADMRCPGFMNAIESTRKPNPEFAEGCVRSR
jgi:4-aminobutyrate aminotransferase